MKKLRSNKDYNAIIRLKIIIRRNKSVPLIHTTRKRQVLSGTREISARRNKAGVSVHSWEINFKTVTTCGGKNISGRDCHVIFSKTLCEGLTNIQRVTRELSSKIVQKPVYIIMQSVCYGPKLSNIGKGWQNRV